MKGGMKSPEWYLSEFLNLTKISQRWISSNLVIPFILSDVTNCQKPWIWMPSCWLCLQGEMGFVVGDRARNVWGHCAWYPLCQGHLSSMAFEPSQGLAHWGAVHRKPLLVSLDKWRLVKMFERQNRCPARSLVWLAAQRSPLLGCLS